MGTRLNVLITLTLASASTFVGLTPQPAFAACEQREAGTPTLEATPWPQRIWDLDRLPTDAKGTGIKVAVLDSGVDTEHPQLRDKVVSVMDVLYDLPESEDCKGHGTGVAGLIAAKPVGGTPFRGLAPDAQIVSARVSESIDKEDTGQARALPTEVAEAVTWAVTEGAQVINMSFVYTDENEAGLEPLRLAIETAIAQGVVVVAAAGNSFKENNPTPYPAAWPNVVGVAAIAEDGFQRLEQSGAGEFVDISAPGVNVWVPVPGGGYKVENGTSFAAPLVAATAALIFDRFSENGGISGADVVKRLLATADPAPGGRRSDGYGVGIVNPVRAVTEVLDDREPVPAAAMPGPDNDPAALAAAARAEQRKQQAWWIGAIGAVVGILAVALMIGLPAGTRRRWRPAGR